LIDDNAGRVPEGPRYPGWREPSLREAFVDGYSQRIPGTPFDLNVRTLLTSVLAATVAALLLPSLRSGIFTPLLGVVLVILISAYRAARLQQQLGRPSTRAYAAVAGLIAAAMVAIVPFILVSWLFGPTFERAPLLVAINAVIRRFGILVFFVLFLGSFWVLAVILQRRQRRAGGQPREAVIEAAIRDEQDARARAQGRSTEST
jgi:hypothetical protein